MVLQQSKLRARRVGSMRSTGAARTTSAPRSSVQSAPRASHVIPGEQVTDAQKHALIRTVMSSMAIEGVFVPDDMAERALEISLAGLATGRRRLGQHVG